VPSSRSLLAAWSGLAAALAALLVPLAAGYLEPGYSHVSQFISELGAHGARHGALVSLAGFGAIGVLVLVFLGASGRSLPRSGATLAGLVCFGAVGAAYLAAAVFRCDAGCPASGSMSQSVHNLFGLLEYVGAFAGLLLLGWGLRGWRTVAAASVVAAVFVLAGFLGMASAELEAYRGISQRIAEAAIFLWIGYVSVALSRAD